MDTASRLKAHLPEECARWLDGFGGDLAAAWRACARADWLLAMSLAVDLQRDLVVLAAYDLAHAALEGGPKAPSANRALRLALAWSQGNASSSEAWASGFSAMEAADRCAEDRAREAAIRAAAFVAFACDDLADATFYLHRSYATKAAEAAAVALESRGAPEAWATLVRARIPLERFLAAFEVASQPPPPQAEEAEQEPPSDGFYT